MHEQKWQNVKMYDGDSIITGKHTKQVNIMLCHSEDNVYIKMLTHLTDQEIETLWQADQ